MKFMPFLGIVTWVQSPALYLAQWNDHLIFWLHKIFWNMIIKLNYKKTYYSKNFNLVNSLEKCIFCTFMDNLTYKVSICILPFIGLNKIFTLKPNKIFFPSFPNYNKHTSSVLVIHFPAIKSSKIGFTPSVIWSNKKIIINKCWRPLAAENCLVDAHFQDQNMTTVLCIWQDWTESTVQLYLTTGPFLLLLLLHLKKYFTYY